MKRLKTIFRSMEEKTETYPAIYSAPITIHPPENKPPYADHDPVFYDGQIGFEFTNSHKLADDRPIVTIRIPMDEIIFNNQKESDAYLKRLKYYFRQMEEHTETYSYKGPNGQKHDIYDGFTIVHFPPKDNPLVDDREPETDHMNTYWEGTKSYEIERSHKLAQDRPIVTASIPADEIDLALEERMTTSPGLKKQLEKAAADFCLRAFAPYVNALNAELYNRSRPDKENGKFELYRPTGEVLVRNTAFFAVCAQRDYEYLSGSSVLLYDPEEHPTPAKYCLCIRMQIQLPFHKLKRAMTMLTASLPDAVELFVAELNRKKLTETLELAEKQYCIREALRSSPYCAFVANGSILPRAKGGILPMDGAIPFTSTARDEIELCGVRGMGIPRGVTLITGGGYSGKSTLLDAIAAGIYDHCSGDGRELVLTDETAVSIAAEDGRAVTDVNISPFIKELPGGKSNLRFSTEHASGSTSQASGIMEAMDAGAKLLLIDEDRSATNFMIRDAKMKALIKKEPITPFTDRIRELAGMGVSTILVIGGSGEYLGAADRIYLMDDYVIRDATDGGRMIWEGSDSTLTPPPPCDWTQTRRLQAEGFTSYPPMSHTERLVSDDMGVILIGAEKIDVRGLYNLMTDAQRSAAAFILRDLMLSHKPGPVDLDRELAAVYEKIDRAGLHAVFSAFFTTMEMPLDLPREIEVKAVVNRMRRVCYR